MTETYSIVAPAVRLLEQLGAMVERRNSGTRGGVRMGRAGTPDIIVIVPPRGRVLGIECKLPGEKLRPAQEKWRDQCLRNGGAFAVAYSVQDVVDAWMKEMRRVA